MGPVYRLSTSNRYGAKMSKVTGEPKVMTINHLLRFVLVRFVFFRLAKFALASRVIPRTFRGAELRHELNVQ